jgi:hypothetical protein
MPKDRDQIVGILTEDTKANVGPNAAKRVAEDELRHFSPQEISLFVEQFERLSKKKGNHDICGPDFNRHVGYPIWMRATLYMLLTLGTLTLLPVQAGVAFRFLLRGQIKPIIQELPNPTSELWEWTTGMTFHIKTPIHLIKQSVVEKLALCINRKGKFKLLKQGYSVLSHVWAQTMGWTTPNGFGPVDLSLRKIGIAYPHFLKFFDRCDSEWLWVDFLAEPDILEDMTFEEKKNLETLQVQIINQLKNIYSNADKVVVLETNLLRLQTSSNVDVAISIISGQWIQRLWTFIEARLGPRIIIKTKDTEFDLDQIIDYLERLVTNSDHRYFPLYRRLSYLRNDTTGERIPIVSPYRPDSREKNIFVDIVHGSENRWTGNPIDKARALFPLLGLEWIDGWSLTDGLDHISQKYPEQEDLLIQYCNYHDIKWK